MLYKSQRYKDEINSSFPDSIRENFEILKRISNNWTSDNERAHMIDEALIVEINDYLSGNDPELTRLVRQFGEMFNALKSDNSGGGKGGSVDEGKVAEIVSQQLKNQKFGFENLSDEIRNTIESTRSIVYTLPGDEKSKAPKPTNLRPIAIKIVDDLKAGNNVMLIGGAGTGKTYLAKQIANEVWGKSPMVINCSQWTSPTEIIGGYTIDGYREGKLIDAYRDGHILLLDEMPKLDPNTAGLLNDALSNTRLRGKAAIIQNAAGSNIEKHVNFACIATGNVYPNSTDIAYAANNKQDLSLLDRFSGSVYFLQKDEKFEKSQVGVRFIWQVADAIRTRIDQNKWEAQISLRWMIGARTIFIREWERYHGTRKDGLRANEGVTFAEFLDKFIAVFTAEQQADLKSAIDYNGVMAEYRIQLRDPELQQYSADELK